MLKPSEPGALSPPREKIALRISSSTNGLPGQEEMFEIPEDNIAPNLLLYYERGSRAHQTTKEVGKNIGNSILLTEFLPI